MKKFLHIFVLDFLLTCLKMKLVLFYIKSHIITSLIIIIAISSCSLNKHIDSISDSLDRIEKKLDTLNRTTKTINQSVITTNIKLDTLNKNFKKCCFENNPHPQNLSNKNIHSENTSVNNPGNVMATDGPALLVGGNGNTISIILNPKDNLQKKVEKSANEIFKNSPMPTPLVNFSYNKDSSAITLSTEVRYYDKNAVKNPKGVLISAEQEFKKIGEYYNNEVKTFFGDLITEVNEYLNNLPPNYQHVDLTIEGWADSIPLKKDPFYEGECGDLNLPYESNIKFYTSDKIIPKQRLFNREQIAFLRMGCAYQQLKKINFLSENNTHLRTYAIEQVTNVRYRKVLIQIKIGIKS